jgi:hypothetical protein
MNKKFTYFPKFMQIKFIKIKAEKNSNLNFNGIYYIKLEKK